MVSKLDNYKIIDKDLFIVVKFGYFLTSLY